MLVLIALHNDKVLAAQHLLFIGQVGCASHLQFKDSWNNILVGRKKGQQAYL